MTTTEPSPKTAWSYLRSKHSSRALSKHYTLHVITADTFGSVHAQLEGYDVNIKVLSTEYHTEEKAAYITQLGKEACVAVGNGNNDAAMLMHASVGIAIMGDEGCAKDALMGSDVLCKNITEALSLVLESKRFVATLRR